MGLLGSKALMNGCIQIVVPVQERTALLYNAHYPNSTGNPGVRQMYDTVRQHDYWPHMSQDVHAYVSQCKSCRRHRPFDEQQPLFELLPLSRLLEFFAIDILGPLTWTKHETPLTIVMTDRVHGIK